jgi:hypothetical protein
MSERDRARLHAIIFHAVPTYENCHYGKYRQYLFRYNEQKYFEAVLAVHKPWYNAILLYIAAVILPAYLPSMLRIF